MFFQLLPTAVAVLSGDDVLSVVQSWLSQASQFVDGIIASKCGGFPLVQGMKQLSCFFFEVVQFLGGEYCATHFTTPRIRDKQP